ncbi:MAG: hypothetical protein PUI41_03135 [Lachnospiraceae bacterium]|nr:hypothetical protein [Lachnospiraceae bacterium]MDY3223879.1 hypothetical protein [Lachnospiraceae bacterium]MDY4098041.1 hypothetical protein [Lachnospiraceae bacterium]
MTVYGVILENNGIIWYFKNIKRPGGNGTGSKERLQSSYGKNDE